MKRLVSLLLCIFLVVVAYAQQGDRLVDSMGNLVYQYNRSATYLEPGKCKVTVTIVNGNKQLGVSFRQEVFRSQLQWQETVGGDTTFQKSLQIS